MERVHQMHVVPDVIPDLHPSLDLRVSFPEHKTKEPSTTPKYTFVEPGVFLLPEQVGGPLAPWGCCFSEQIQDG